MAGLNLELRFSNSVQSDDFPPHEDARQHLKLLSLLKLLCSVYV